MEKRFQEHGISGLLDLSARGHVKKYTKYDEARVINLACVLIKEWLLRKRKISLHFTPTYSSWLNLIEVLFGILTKAVLKNAVWRSKEELIEQLKDWIM